MSSEASPTQNDPLFGNAASDLLREAAGTEGKPPSDPRYWQPPTPEELQSRLTGYVIEAFLARGGMGAVYRGVQTSLERHVAIKILPPQLSEHDASFAQRFKQEARAMAQLNHPGIVSVYDFGEMSDGTLYFIMEFIDGTDVGQMVARQGRLSSAHAMAITAHVCDALQYAHENGVVHRDIKPANIMVGHDGRVKVADFGLAKSFNSGHTSLTMTGHVMGTPHFVAPEALTLGSSVDHRADIYAVGVMLYQMLTGRLPQGIFEMPSLLVAGLDPRYDAIVASAMREDRNARYQAMLDMRHALNAILTQPIQRAEVSASLASPAPRPQPDRNQPQTLKSAPLVQKNSGTAIGLVAVAVVFLIGGIFWTKRQDAVASPSAAAVAEPSKSGLKQAPQDAVDKTTEAPPAPILPAPAPPTPAALSLAAIWKNRCTAAERLETMRRMGGSPHVETGVSAALHDLKAIQNPDGSWARVCRSGKTALALQAYLGRCETTESKDFGDPVIKGITFLIEMGKKSSSGILAAEAASSHADTEHAMATEALAQMYLAARTGSKSLPGMRETFEKGIRLIIQSQATASGHEKTSLLTLAWQAEALNTAKLTKLKFDGLSEGVSRLALVIKQAQKPDGSFSGQEAETPQAITGACVRALQILPGDHKAAIAKGIQFARQHYQKEPLDRANMDLHAVFFCTRAFFRQGGDDWKFWNQQMLPLVLAALKPDGSISCPPSALMPGDDIDNTALAALTLETYFRDSPHLGEILSTTTPTAPPTKRLMARYVRIDGAQGSTLHLAEVEVISGGKNIGPLGKAMQSSMESEGKAQYANDGDTNGDSKNGGRFTHTNSRDKSPRWDLDLGEEYPIDTLVIWNCTDDGFKDRLKGFTVKLRTKHQSTCWEKKVEEAPLPSTRLEVGAP